MASFQGIIWSWDNKEWVINIYLVIAQTFTCRAKVPMLKCNLAKPRGKGHGHLTVSLLFFEPASCKINYCRWKIDVEWSSKDRVEFKRVGLSSLGEEVDNWRSRTNVFSLENGVMQNWEWQNYGLNFPMV